jgi:tRNA A-37 threonylcarbamoyl transferase component Bud32
MHDLQTPATAERIAAIAADCRQRWAAGQEVSHAEICSRHPDLEPQLGRALRALALIESARRQAQPNVMDAGADSYPASAHSHSSTFSRADSSSLDFRAGARRMDSGDAKEVDPLIAASQVIAGTYALLERIGKGGMGVVYKARHEKLDRIVAIKMIQSGELADEEEIRRFKTEAQAAARFDHPNIVGVLDFGEDRGRQFLVMNYIAGHTLAERITDGPLAPREAAQIVCKLAQAVEYAHQRNVLHRDIKPANVLVDERGEPRLADFGLCKCTDSGHGQTTTGRILGTPGYMPPEQALGDPQHIGRHSDIYSLGALLYALLTGRPPFRAQKSAAALYEACHQPAQPPSKLNRTAAGPLDTICLKCLEKDPRQRYASAADLASDLQRYLQGKRIQARPAPARVRLWRWGKRRASLLAMIAACLVMVLFVGGFVYRLVSAARNPSLPLVDDFEDGRLNEKLWRVASGKVIEHDGQVELNDRGVLVTRGQYDPSKLGGIRIKGRYTFKRATRPYHDLLQVFTRCDGIVVGKYREIRNGIQFQVTANGFVRLNSHIDGMFYAIGEMLPVRIDDGDVFDFEAVDDGRRLYFQLNEVGGQKTTLTISGTSDLVFAKNHVAFSNRERANSPGVNYLDQVRIERLATP